MYFNYIIEADYKIENQYIVPIFDKEINGLNYTTNSRKLNNGRYFFLIKVPNIITEKDIVDALGNHGNLISKSYSDLYKSKSNLKYEILEINCLRKYTDGELKFHRCSLSSLVQGDIIEDKKVYPPIIYSGDETEDIEILEQDCPKQTTELKGNEISNKAIYLLSNIGLSFPKSDILQLTDTIRWVPSCVYKKEHPIFSSYNDFQNNQPFTGCIEIDINDPIVHDPELLANRLNYRGIINRFVAAVSLLTYSKPTIIKEIFIENSSISVQNNIYNQNIYNKGDLVFNISEEEFKFCLELALLKNSNNLLGAIRNSLDAITHASLSWDSKISYILLWAAIESLTLEDQRDGLTLHNSLVLLGAHERISDKLELLEQFKGLYKTRSKLVHGFKDISDNLIKEHRELTVRSFSKLFLKACEVYKSGEIKHSIFVNQMLKNSLT